jgi:integrase
MKSDSFRYTYMAKGQYPRFRHPLTGDVPLPGRPGDDVFAARYGELLAKVKAGSSASAAKDDRSLAWLAERWQESQEFKALRPQTQITYQRTIAVAVTELGEEPYALVTRRMVKTVRNDLAKETPRKAQMVKEAVSAMYSWADEEELVEEGFNPGKGFRKLKTRRQSYVAWSDEEVELVLRHASPNLTTLILLSLYTGQRASDVVAMDWCDVQGDVIRVRQSKTQTKLSIHCHPRLKEHLDRLRAAGRVSGPIAVNQLGTRNTTTAYRHLLCVCIKRIPNMPRRTPHGLRYTAAAKLEQAGCTMARIVAILGHNTYKMALQYLTQRHDAKAAIEQLQQYEESQAPVQERSGRR